jgi:DNA-binding transcriptional regulator YhcF (GntR family)
MDIENGCLEKDEQLMSINFFSKQHKIARDTVEKAYMRLKVRGYITSVKGKGYYSLGKNNNTTKVLFIFNKLSSYKKIIYDAFVKTLGDDAIIDVFIHNYSATSLMDNLQNNIGKYRYYVIMPHFFDHVNKDDYLKVLSVIPRDQLIWLDKNISQVTNFTETVQHAFQHDVMKY